MKTLLYAGAAAGPLFVAVVLVEGAARAGYDPIQHPISSLALGEGGWLQTATFLVAGALSLALAVGLARSPGPRPRWAAALVGLWGAGLLGTGLFVTDPVNGYPPGTPDVPQGTASGQLHNLFALVGAVAFVVACVLLRVRGARGWRVASLSTGALFVVTLALASAGFGAAGGLVSVGGLFDRIAVFTAWAWLTAMALRTARAGSTISS
jgi:hypothetical protein